MKLNITLSLALASACSAFALSPGGTTQSKTSTTTHQRPSAAFVTHPSLDASTKIGSELARRQMALKASASSSSDAMSTRGGSALSKIDIPLVVYFALWYLGNYYYNITNKLALKATGGAAGFPMTISALQLGIGSLYGIFLWLAPDARKKPTVTMDDVSFECFE